MNKKYKLIVRSVFSLLALAVVANYAFAWTAPTAAPTGGNVPVPLNTGDNTQIKNAGLQLVGDILATGNGVIQGFLYASKARIGCQISLGSNCPSMLGPNLFSVGSVSGGQIKGVNVPADGTFMAGTIGGFTGQMSVGALLKGLKVNPVSGQVSIVDGTQAAGKVFTSDANGNGSWADGMKIGTQFNAPVHNNEMLIYKNPGVTGSTDAGWKAAITIPVYKKNYACVAGAPKTSYFLNKSHSGELTTESTCRSNPCDDAGHYWACGQAGSTFYAARCGDGTGTPTVLRTTPDVCDNLEAGKLITCTPGNSSGTGPDNMVHCN